MHFLHVTSSGSVLRLLSRFRFPQSTHVPTP
jgi:hypothetical protein